VNNDAELLASIRNGAMDDFGEIIRRHQSHVFGILYRYEQDSGMLEDLAQETFIKAWRALHRFDGRAPFQHWLSRIAVRVALDHLRREKGRGRNIGLESLGEDVHAWLRTEESGDLSARDASELLSLAMRELSPAEQLVITLQALEGRSIKEICERTGSSSVAVRVRCLRARAKLRRALERLENLAGVAPQRTAMRTKVHET
jgi:RNA polymerase sigma-70 factor (ECF subfamily)